MSIFKNKKFVMCELPGTIQNAILEVQVLAAKKFKYNQNNNLDNLVLEIEKIENHQEFLDKNFNFEKWEQVLNYYFNDQLKVCKSNSPYSLLSTIENLKNNINLN